jgi:uncharacterized damage-inducible protein DinB
MKAHYLQLFRYEDWAMRKIIPLLEESQDEAALKLFQHILLAREVWFNRVTGANNPYLFDGKSLAECVESYQKNQAEWMSFLATADFEAMVNYQTMEGAPFSDKIKDILTHVVNHSTYHRGQITNCLKGKIELVSTDFIFFLREK